MPSVQERQIGSNFDILDKAVAGRFFELNSRPTIARQTYNEWLTEYNQLAAYARNNSNVAYVARQWAAEEPRYRGTFATLQAKIVDTPLVKYTPSLYNSDISIKSGGCCGCGSDNQLPTLPGTNYTPGTTNIPQRPGTTIAVSTGSGFPSLGDLLRDLFGTPKAAEVPMINAPYPDSQLINESGIFSGIITALIVGAILYVIHRATMKK